MLSPQLSDPRALARELAARQTFWIFAAVLAVAAAANAWSGRSEAWPAALPAVGYALAALLCVWATRLQGQAADRALTAAGIVGVVLMAGTAWIYGWGLNGLGMGFLAIVTLAFAAFFSVRAGVAMAALCIAIVLLLGWAEQQGSIAGLPALSRAGLWRRVVTVSLLVLTGLAVGMLIVRLVGHWLQAARDRERRFVTVLGIATDSYWEMNADLVVTAVWRRDPQGEFQPLQVPLLHPWEEPGLAFDDEDALRQHRADLEARRPFRNLHVCHHAADGSVRHDLVSGTPRFDSQRRFTGYWGVSRDATAEYGARDTLRSAEEDSREAQAILTQLLETSPNVLSLSEADSGRFVMVSAMFERTFGYARHEVIGRNSGELGLWCDPKDRERLLAAIAAEGRVQDMVLSFRARDGSERLLSCSASVSPARGRRYLVMIGRDVSERERERREREAILDNASIGIALTRERRFVLVNHRFEELFDWPAGTLIGQSGAVVWPSEAEYAEIGARHGPTLARGEAIAFEGPMRRRDGSTFLARVVGKAIDRDRPREGGTVWIVDDITERREVEHALAQARDAAEAANRAKSAFLANTSHEIRTPLNGLLGLARLARQRGIGEAQRQHYLDEIADSAENLSAIISDILDLSKIEAGKLELESSDFDLHALLQSLQRAYMALAQPRGLSLTLQIDPALPQWVRGDAMRLRQILSNYLTNALKFTERGGVRLLARPGRDGRLRCEVIDTGPGIDLATQARLFQPFTQADDSITRRYGGTGLGLSICLQLARLMGGEVGLVSRPGAGATFFVELPLPAVDLPPPALATAQPEPSAALAGMHVLLVEDNPVNMMVAQAMLEHWGVRTEAAENGHAAVAAVTRAVRHGDPFDAVLMDVQMPGMSGYETTQVLRRDYPAEVLPVIALTAAALVSEREHALAYGMTDFLTKPIDSARLLAALAKCLRRGAR